MERDQVFTTMDAYFYSLDDDFFDLGDPEPGDYADSLDSPCSPGSDLDTQIIYDPLCSSLQPSLFDPSLVSIPHTPAHAQYKPPVKKVSQRKAANMRERRRMKCINDAFEALRTCIPSEVQCAERRLSKVDTLKLAVRYIAYLGELLQSCGDYNHALSTGSTPRGQTRLQEKVIVRSRLPEHEDLHGEVEGTVVGHSLSWDDPKGRRPPPHSRLVAKVWVPELPTQSDLVNLATYCADY